MGELRRRAETVLDIGTFVAAMAPAVATGLLVAALGQGLRVGVGVLSLAAAALPSR